MRNRNADVSVAFNKTHTLELKHVSSAVKVDWDGGKRSDDTIRMRVQEC